MQRKLPWQQQFKQKPKDGRTWNGILFHSALEMRVFIDLKRMEEAGEVKNVVRQVRHYLILPNGVPIKTAAGRTCWYTTDMEWDEVATDEHKIAEVKGYADDYAKFRMSVFEAVTGYKLIIIKK